MTLTIQNNYNYWFTSEDCLVKIVLQIYYYNKMLSKTRHEQETISRVLYPLTRVSTHKHHTHTQTTHHTQTPRTHTTPHHTTPHTHHTTHIHIHTTPHTHRQCYRTFPCSSWSLVDVLIRIVLTGNYKKKFFSHFSFSLVQYNAWHEAIMIL